MNKQKKEIQNTFFDVIALIVSFFLSIFYAIFAMFGNKKAQERKSYFFEMLDFLFRIWPQSFFKKPSLYKITSFFGELLKYLFKR